MMNQDDNYIRNTFVPKFYKDGDIRNPYQAPDIRAAFWEAEREAFSPNGVVGLESAVRNGSEIVYGLREGVEKEFAPGYLTSNEKPLQERIMLAYIRDFIPTIGWVVDDDLDGSLASYFES